MIVIAFFADRDDGFPIGNSDRLKITKSGRMIAFRDHGEHDLLARFDQMEILTDFRNKERRTETHDVSIVSRIAHVDQMKFAAAEKKMLLGRGHRKHFAIVNAANCSLLGGGGVDGAIHRAAGWRLLAACIKFNGCRTGEARITPGFKLPAKFVIHTPGPVWHGGKRNEPELLKNCYLNSLALAKENNCRTIAFPCISTGVYRFPKEPAAQIALETVRDHAVAPIEKVIFCCFSESDAEIYRQRYAEMNSI